MDTALFTAINGAHAPWLDQVMRGVTWLGYFPGIWFLSGAAALAVPRLRPAALRLCLAVALTYGLTVGVVKPLVHRDRPNVAGLVAARTVEAVPSTDPSFPSGHAATAVAGALAGTTLLPALRVPLWALATAMAYSRVYVGVHYPSDVLAGALLGAACAFLVLGGFPPSVSPQPARAPGGVTFRP
ncbi:MAG: phosphatase PAP2 family protein [Vicinamibacterales bacterium]